MSGLLLVCLSFYLLMSISVFKTDKTQLVYDLNRSQVSTLANEIEARLSGVDQTLGVFAELQGRQQKQFVKTLCNKDPDIISLQTFKVSNDRPAESFVNKDFLETYGLTNAIFSKKNFRSGSGRLRKFFL